MDVRIITVFQVSPELFWQRLFFDREYNRGLYRALGFVQYDVEHLETSADGRIRRVLKAVPPIKAPEIVRRKLEGRLYYREDGTYDPRSGLWTFQIVPSLAAESAKISGVIRTEPDAAGMHHVCDLSARVSAFGLGGLIERAIEKNTRDSYRLTAQYTSDFVKRPEFQRELAAASPL
jgi:Protein of unknown function (DUF2505)